MQPTNIDLVALAWLDTISWSIGARGSLGVWPAAQLEEQQKAMCGTPTSLISLDSGPSVIPTTWAPRALSAVISAGVSNCGPLLCADTMPVNELNPFSGH